MIALNIKAIKLRYALQALECSMLEVPAGMRDITGTIAKYFATSFAILKVVTAPHVMRAVSRAEQLQ